MILIDTPLSEIIEEIGLPKHTKFVGYVIRLPEKAEFLSSYNCSEDSVSMAWAKVPDLAFVFDNVEAAQKVLLQLDKPAAMLGWLFDLGDQYFVASLTQNDNG